MNPHNGIVGLNHPLSESNMEPIVVVDRVVIAHCMQRLHPWFNCGEVQVDGKVWGYQIPVVLSQYEGTL